MAKFSKDKSASKEQMDELALMAGVGLNESDAQEYIEAYKLAIKRATTSGEIHRIQRLVKFNLRALRGADYMG